MRLSVLVVALLFPVLACHRATRRNDFEMVCNAVERSGVTTMMNPAERTRLLSDYIAGHLETDEGKQFFGAAAILSHGQRGAALRQAAAAAGYDGACPFADEP